MLTAAPDEDSRIMPVPGGGFEQAYNAQAAVATGSQLVVATDVVQAANDKEQVAPMLAALAALPEAHHTLAKATQHQCERLPHASAEALHKPL
jgi:hypothetical protein